MLDDDVEVVQPDPGGNTQRVAVSYNGTSVSLSGTPAGALEPNPLPMVSQTRSYQVDAIRNPDGSYEVKINPGVFDLDPTRPPANANNSNTKYVERPNLDSPIIGVYSGGVNYFVPGKFYAAGSTIDGVAHNRYSVIKIDADKAPTSWGEIQRVTVTVWANSLDGVYTAREALPDPQIPKRINYFKDVEWTSGVITGSWKGSGSTATMPGNAAPNAYSVTPDINPDAVRMQAVTGMFIPQIMSAVDSDPEAHMKITPVDINRIKSVLGVYALRSMNGTRVDDTNVTPDDPSDITFVSAVYAVAEMAGVGIDARHVSPEIPALISKVTSVTVVGQAGDYYDGTDPYTAGDASIALSRDLPAGNPEIVITYESVDLYDADNPDLAFTQGDIRLRLNRALPENANQVRIVYGVGTGLDGDNYYDPTNVATAFQLGDEDITLRKALPANVTDVRVLYGTDQQLISSGSRVDDADDFNVDSPNLWSISRIAAVYPIVQQGAVAVAGAETEQTGALLSTDPLRMTVVPSNRTLIKKVLRVVDAAGINYYDSATTENPYDASDDANPYIVLTKAVPASVTGSLTIRFEPVSQSVTPYDTRAMYRVTGVYPVTTMKATNINDSRVAPESPYSIKEVRGVYARANQPGTTDPADANRKTAVPSSPGIISEVIGVFAAGDWTINYFDPENPETTYRSGDATVKLSTALPLGVTDLVIYYKSVNLATNPESAFTPGSLQVTLETPVPASDPPVDTTVFDPQKRQYWPIEVEYVTNANYYGSGTSPISLWQPLPRDSVNAVVVYAKETNLYGTYPIAPVTSPYYAPGDSQIPLITALPSESDNVLIVYSAHLFLRSYNPNDYDYTAVGAASSPLRPFLPGDRYLRLNRLKPDTVMPARFTNAGALKLCIAYQSLGKRTAEGTYSNYGGVQLPLPLPMSDTADAALPQLIVYADYRPASSVDGPLNESPPKEGIIIGTTFTLSRPYMGVVERLSYYEPDPIPEPLPQIGSNGSFTWWAPRGQLNTTVTYRRQEPDSRNGVLWMGLGGKYNGRVPLDFIQYSPDQGSQFRQSASAGMNMSNPLQQPSASLDENLISKNNRMIFWPNPANSPAGNRPMWYAPGLVANSDGSPRTFDLSVSGAYYQVNNGVKTITATQSVTVYDSRPPRIGEMIDHGGMDGDRDDLASYPSGGEADPLIPEPAEELNASLPDDGSSSTQFVFRVRYTNADGRPPLPWLHWSDDPWCNDDRASGVVLYLDEKGTGDYQPHFMAPENPAVTGAGAMYIYRVIPHHAWMEGGGADPLAYPWNDDGSYYTRTYESLACGVYHYFFACSDDSLAFADGSFPFENQGTLAKQLEWGHSAAGPTAMSSSTGLDPSLARNVTGFSEIGRPGKRRYSVDGRVPYDSTIHVDRPLLVPGQFAYKGYPLSADSHPKVTCELRMPVADDLLVPYDDAKYGYGRFFGTLDPYYRMMSPLFRVGANSANDPIYHGESALGGTSGATAQTDNVFRILYKQIDNKPPIYMRVHINNAAIKSGTGAQYAYTSYPMYPRADQTQPYDYRTGVWYEYKSKLAPGPHTYYFQSYDGEHIVRFPVRPDKIAYSTAGGYYLDGWVPTPSTAAERGTADYFDNDYFPGPYVNHPCVLSEATVTPGTGKEGENFKYRVKYSDADGQRVYSGYVYVEVNSRGDVRRFSMIRETPFLDPAADHAQDYINGVYYVLDTGTIKDFALENGIRRFYFEFIDDWGPSDDLNDTVQGETTRYPQGAGNWITGPVISGNHNPTLTNGSVESQDGTANAATLWTYRVTYRDLDNDAPSLIKLYLGLLQPDGKTIIWDDGHSLQKSNTADTVYSDGAEYFFQTRLGAADSSEDKQYFYAFETFDGTDWAAYNSSSNDETRSNAAGCMVLDDLLRIDSTRYKVRPLIAQQATATSTTAVMPDNAGDIVRVWGVYASEDLEGGTNSTNYCDLGADPPAYAGGAIALTTALSGSQAKVWVKYEARSPLVGPLPIDLPAPAGVIPDPLIYVNYSSAPTAILIDDQKNGWINDDPSYPDDRGTVRMNALAVFEGQASTTHVTPDSPRDIASVEGVYLTSDMSGTNYCDPSLLEPPMMRRGTVDPSDPMRKTVIPDEPDRINYVTGVFGQMTPTGENYFLGTGYPNTVKWQEALIVSSTQTSGVYTITGTNTVWPKNPADIVTIKGVYLSMDTNTANYYRTDGIAAQAAAIATRLVQASNPGVIGAIKGIYTSASTGGTNYYNPLAASVPYFYNVAASLPAATTTVSILYTPSGGGADAWQNGTVYVNGVLPSDPRPIYQVNGVYTSVTYDANGLPTGTGRNYAPSSSYVNGGAVIPITPPIQASSLLTGRMYVVYKGLDPGFGPQSEYIATNKDMSSLTVTTAYVAYYPRGTVSQIQDKKFITLSTPVPAGLSEVGIRVIAKSFKCGDQVIPLTRNLPDGTTNVYVKYSDIRFTHQLRGSATQPTYSELYWNYGASHYTPDGWNAAATDGEWMAASAVDTLTVRPEAASSIMTVLGVYAAIDTESDDYYEGTTNAFVKGDSVVELARPLPNGTSQVYVHYLSDNVHIKNNLEDITGGVIGVWLNTTRDGTNLFDPRQMPRHADDPAHLRLTTTAPDGTYLLWARYYQRGDYHIDRWNREVRFVTGKEKEATDSIQASYFFGTKMPQTLGANTAPTLLEGKLSKQRGSRSDEYVFSVTYRDLDGPNGQAPVYIRVYIDGTAYNMTAASQGTPAYREGAVYTYTPSGLIGGSHKYHFEASDGAAVALYDWYDENNQERPLTGQTVRDIDGPWVNNPPDLTNGAVSPNPPAGINPWDSVDYTVTYTDPDNDEPYFWDSARDTVDADTNNNSIPDGKEWSGSPKVWIDSGAVDKLVNGTVSALEDDPMEPGKKRTIVAAGAPGWAIDEFAGKLLQISNGLLSGRVYLIQSNTADRLVIATDDLGADGIKTSSDATASEFRINGLLMSKADPTQQDYTVGVVFKITVPKLASGDHKYHFTARSRETKPQWLVSKLTTAENVPYSSEVRFPTGSDASGPKVKSTPPQGNVAPILANTKDTSLYVGPVYQMATATALDEVRALDATKFALIREVRGVFENANDFALSAITDDDALNYYDPLTASPVFKTGDSRIVLTRSLPAVPGTTLAQFGSADSVSLQTVTPDVAGVIETILGVYLVSDPEFAGTDYYKTADGLSTGTFSDGVITLGRPLPSGTQQVYVSYTRKASSSWTTTPAVPVYVKHYKVVTLTNTTVFSADDLVAFRVSYTDADGDRPSYHDGVQGYVKVVFNDLGTSKLMQLLNPTGGAVDYTTPQTFTTVPMNPPEGVHKYHFEASDGYYTVTWPTGTQFDPRANDYQIKVNYKPVLSAGRVDPTAGQVATTFTMTVNYKDTDGPGAAAPQVYARVTKLDGAQGYIRKAMKAKTTSPNYANGVDFDLQIVPSQMQPALTPGNYKVVFEATDGDGEDAVPMPSGSQTAVQFTIRDVNNAPVLSEPTVTPAAGKLDTTYVYKAKYSDPDGDAPIGKSDGTKDVLTLIIDKGTALEQEKRMTKISTAPASPTVQNYIDGLYYVSAPISGKALGAGDHTFEIRAGDGTADATPVSSTGPVLLIPYFVNFRAVSASATNPETAPSVTQAVVGQEVVFLADMKFPDNPLATPPDPITNISVQVTKPDGSSVELSAHTSDLREEFVSGDRVGWTAKVRATYPEGIDSSLVTGTSLTLTGSGDWVVNMSWPQNSTWDAADTVGHDLRISVGGPMRTAAVADPTRPSDSTPLVDMITPPEIIGSTDVGAIFGVERALDLQIVRWDPSARTYFRYGTSGTFPNMYPGNALWIKPRSSYPTEAILLSMISSGQLTLGNPEAAASELKKYRLIKAFVRDYDRDTTSGAPLPCTISLRTGWNQFGNIFFNWKKDGGGGEIVPRVDVGLPISEVAVRYLNSTKTLTQAAQAGWIRDYAWRWDAVSKRYVMVHATATGAERVLKAWSGYWINALVDCSLIITPTTTYNGTTAAASRSAAPAAVTMESVDMPPPAPE